MPGRDVGAYGSVTGCEKGVEMHFFFLYSVCPSPKKKRNGKKKKGGGERKRSWQEKVSSAAVQMSEDGYWRQRENFDILEKRRGFRTLSLVVHPSLPNSNTTPIHFHFLSFRSEKFITFLSLLWLVRLFSTPNPPSKASRARKQGEFFHFRRDGRGKRAGFEKRESRSVWKKNVAYMYAQPNLIFTPRTNRLIAVKCLTEWVNLKVKNTTLP